VLVTPLGSELVVIDSTGTMVMLNAFVAVSAGVLESVAVTEKLEVPAVVGVPVIAPFAASVRPVGSAPVVTAQVIGVAPPVDCRVAL
jgi:hypothetical protein